MTEKPIIDMTENEIRELISKRLSQYKKAQMRVDKFYSLSCIGQAEAYLKKYINLLFIANMKGFSLSEEEKQLVSLKKQRIA